MNVIMLTMDGNYEIKQLCGIYRPFKLMQAVNHYETFKVQLKQITDFISVILEGLFKPPKNNYLKLTDACQTNAKRINKTGITGKTSTIGENGAYASGSFASTSAKVVINILH